MEYIILNSLHLYIFCIVRKNKILFYLLLSNTLLPTAGYIVSRNNNKGKTDP